LLKQFFGAARGTRLMKAIQNAEHYQVLAPSEIIIERSILGRDSNITANLSRLADYIESRHTRTSVIGKSDGSKNSDCRSLTRAIWTEKAKDRPRWNLQVNPCQCDGLSVPLGQAKSLNHG
jgi:hypothetical protein